MASLGDMVSSKNGPSDRAADPDGTGTYDGLTTRPVRRTILSTGVQRSACLVGLLGRIVGQVYPIGRGLSVGRSPEASIQLPDGGVSRLHAVFAPNEDGQVYVEDQQSRNGTWVNGTRVDSRVLREGDRIEIGRETCFKLCFHDDLERHLQEAQKMESLGHLAVGIAHHFNNLLTVVVSNAAFLAEQVESGSEPQTVLEEIEIAARRGAELVRQLVGFADPGIPRARVVNVSALVTEVMAMASRTFPSRIRLVTHLEDPLLVSGEESQLHQVIFNLLLNARDANGVDGEIRVETSQVHLDAESARKLSALLSSGAYVRVRIADSGCGMDQQTLARAFEPFFTTKEVGKGTGLGLSTAFGITKRHRGHLQIESTQGEGTTADLYLPAFVLGGPLTEGEPPPETVREAPSGVVLVVDDRDDVRGAICRQLVRLSLRTLEASGGRQAIETYRAHRSEIGVVLLDVGLPDMDGEVALRELVAFDPTVKVIMISGYGDERAKSLMNAGAVRFLAKPIDSRELTEALSAVLGSESG